MTVQLNNDGTLAITAMSLVEFLPEIETAIHAGFMLDLDKNEGVPQQYGSMLALTMYPVGEVEVSEIDKEDDFKHPDDSTLDTANAIHTVVQQSQDAIAQVVQETALFTNSGQPVKVDSLAEIAVSTLTTTSGTDDFGKTQKIDGRRKKS